MREKIEYFILNIFNNLLKMESRRFQFVKEPITGTIQVIELNRLGCMKLECLLRNVWDILFQMKANDS